MLEHLLRPGTHLTQAERGVHDVDAEGGVLDEVEERIAGALQAGCRETDFAARWGGEEFVLFLPETSAEQAMHICERIRQQISSLDLSAIGETLNITASFGVALRQHETDFNDVLARADKALYAAKAAGRNRVILADA